MGQGQEGFINRNCPKTSCYVTSNRSFLGDYTNFDVVVFAGPEVVQMERNYLPHRRSLHQKYVFASIESSDNYPVCSNRFNNYFNWTWTYKLNSDAQWGYMVIRDAENNVIGPKADMHWMKLDEMAPISEELGYKLKNKTKAAAWFVSNCISRSRRNSYVLDLAAELTKYDLKIDIYGDCGNLKCSRDNEEECDKMIEREYFFYLSFENSFAKDYVTEKLLHPLRNLAVPIVYGGANYSRFMPDGIYLNARELGPKRLAERMNELIEDQNKYAEYFKWRNHYSYHKRHESVETDDYCRFCSILFDETLVETKSVYKNFKKWWDPPYRCSRRKKDTQNERRDRKSHVLIRPQLSFYE
ncbi:alpha-(1,3)-fucosyltransferase C-like [Colias croceus]|uniref:alpha-(1,3)-fucosyltransferase C-like n=1 Tax=Colias crocea TaxID=72248 RepID=UPI001E27C21A|nr:alpha-(1,3)-fucosyltransferase C-like [Colias croceus]